jgi:hypothetical protein
VQSRAVARKAFLSRKDFGLTCRADFKIGCGAMENLHKNQKQNSPDAKAKGADQ